MTRDIIVIGGSTGAVEALPKIVAALPADLDAAVFVCLHLGGGGDAMLVDILASAGKLPVGIAEHGAPVRRGAITVAPVGRHLLVLEDTIHHGRGPRENLSRPSIDPLFRSAAMSYGPRTIGLNLTGALNDGAAGLAAVKQCGGVAVVQNPADARVPDMPLGALQCCEVDYRADADELGSLLTQLSKQTASPPVAIPADLALEVSIALGQPSDTPLMLKLAQPVALTCPTCNGVLSEMHQRQPLRFRCQVGHAYTAEALAHKKNIATDEAMRIALRIIGERASLAEKMAAEARTRGRHHSATSLEQRAAELRQHTEVLRRAIGLL